MKKLNRKLPEFLSRVGLNNFVSLTLDGNSDSVDYEMVVPIDEENGDTLFHTGNIPLSGSTPQYLLDATTAFSKAVLRAVQEEVAITQNEEHPCTDCIGQCCKNWEIHLTKQDVLRISSETGKDPGEFCTMFFKADGSLEETWTGHVGILKQTEEPEIVEGVQNKPCVFLKNSRCSIYEIRPTVCRAYKAWDCEIRVVDPNALPRISLPLLQG